MPRVDWIGNDSGRKLINNNNIEYLIFNIEIKRREGLYKTGGCALESLPLTHSPAH